jgi:hypothetical protein
MLSNTCGFDSLGRLYIRIANPITPIMKIVSSTLFFLLYSIDAPPLVYLGY